jgi:hypothetical protein
VSETNLKNYCAYIVNKYNETYLSLLDPSSSALDRTYTSSGIVRSLNCSELDLWLDDIHLSKLKSHFSVHLDVHSVEQLVKRYSMFSNHVQLRTALAYVVDEDDARVLFHEIELLTEERIRKYAALFEVLRR